MPFGPQNRRKKQPPFQYPFYVAAGAGDWAWGPEQLETRLVLTVTTGSITREFFAGIDGQAVTDLTAAANFPNNPTSTSTLTSFEAPSNAGDQYGQRVHGYLVPAETGDYTF